MFNASDLSVVLPVIVLVIGACVLLMSEVGLKESHDRGYQVLVTGFTAALSFFFSVIQIGDPARPVFNGAAQGDTFQAFICATVAAGLFLSVLVSAGFLRRHHAERGEFYALMLFAGSGMQLLAMSADLVMIFVAIEVMSVATYALSAWLRRGQRPTEAAFKYFILGAFSSALYLYGTALVYGASGTTLLSKLAVPGAISSDTIMGPALALVAVGFAFKVAAVPFHMWAPDVYEGAPTPVTAFMAVGVKAAAFAAFLRTMDVAFGGSDLVHRWAPFITVLAGLTMISGNLLALPQRNVKRMLAYSSIAHAGYLLVAVASSSQPAAHHSAAEGMLFYLAAYTVAAVGAFGTVAALERREGDSATAWDLDRFAGLGKRKPVVAFFMAAFMLSMAGVPPTAGFMAKLLIFKAALDADQVLLAVLGMVSSAIGAYYYLRVVVYMYFREPEAKVAAEDERLPVLEWGLALSAIATIVIGVGPSTIAEAARRGAELLG